MAVPRHNLNLTAQELGLMTKFFVGSAPPLGGRLRFEAALRGYLGAAHVETVSSCREALHLALLGLGLRPGDRVVLPRYTFYSLVHVVTGMGMIPVFAPIDPDNFALDPARLAPTLGRAQAVVLIHPFGQVAPIAEIKALCDAAGVPLIEDASQATGAGVDGQKVGTIGDVGVFSLVTGKNLQTVGGGVLVARSPTVHARIQTVLASACLPEVQRVQRQLGEGLARWLLTGPAGHNLLMRPLTRVLQAFAPKRLEAMFHEERRPFDPEQPLVRLSDVQGELGCMDLPELDRRNRTRRANALQLIEGLRGTVGLHLPRFNPAAENSFNAVAVRVTDAAKLQSALQDRGVDCRSDYMSWYGVRRDFSDEVLYLPNHPGMNPDDVDRVVRAVVEVMGRGF
jgi:dTDP-4-amino-4,6-dideoxygalactose transaminase